MDRITSISRAIMAQPKTKWVALVAAWPDEMHEPIKRRIRLIHSGEYSDTGEPAERGPLHKGFRVYLHSQPGSVAMIDGNGATMDEALKMARWQFGDADVVRVVTGEEDRNPTNGKT